MTAAVGAVGEPRGTGDRMVRVEKAALDLAEAVEDPVREMAAIPITDKAKLREGLDQVNRARDLASAVRDVVHRARRQTPGSLSKYRPFVGVGKDRAIPVTNLGSN
jgi:hypothetical protein